MEQYVDVTSKGTVFLSAGGPRVDSGGFLHPLTLPSVAVLAQSVLARTAPPGWILIHTGGWSVVRRPILRPTHPHQKGG